MMLTGYGNFCLAVSCAIIFCVFLFLLSRRKKAGGQVTDRFDREMGEDDTDTTQV